MFLGFCSGHRIQGLHTVYAHRSDAKTSVNSGTGTAALSSTLEKFWETCSRHVFFLKRPTKNTFGRLFKTHVKGLRQLHHNHDEKSTQSIRARPERGGHMVSGLGISRLTSLQIHYGEHKYSDAADMWAEMTHVAGKTGGAFCPQHSHSASESDIKCFL